MTGEPGANIETMQGQYAGFVTRLVAFLLDALILSLIYSVLAVIVQAIGAFFQRDMLALIGESASSGAIVSAVAGIFPIFYYVFFWALAGQTPGKAFMGIRITPVNGGRLTLRQALLRYLSYWLSALGFFFGFLSVLVDDRRQAWHDKLARTVVIYAWEARMRPLAGQRRFPRRE